MDANQKYLVAVLARYLPIFQQRETRKYWLMLVNNLLTMTFFGTDTIKQTTDSIQYLNNNLNKAENIF